MSKITLVRHGQASFGSANYDLLSEIGRLQAEKVGEYFRQCATQFDLVIHGEMSRQSETAKIIAKSMGHSEELVENKGANEFDSENLIKSYLPQLAERSAEFKQMIHGDNNWFKSDQNFKKVFSELILLWQLDQNCPFESWLSFKLRVKGFLQQVVDDGHPNRRVMIATSGGLISVAFMSLMNLPDDQFTRINLGVNNASLTDLKLNTHRLDEQLNGQILGFNNISPLQLAKDSQLITRK